MLKSSLDQLKKLNTTLLDEHTALQLAFSSLEEKLRGVQVSTNVKNTVVRSTAQIFARVYIMSALAWAPRSNYLILFARSK